MPKWLCTVCNTYAYDSEKGDPETGIKPPLNPKDFPHNWRCPVCGATHEKQVEISNEAYKQKLKTYADFKAEKSQKPSILIGTDNPDARPELAQEYGKFLGLRGIGQGLGYLNNLRALNEIKLKIRLISKHEEPNFRAEFFGAKLNMPVMGASMSGLSLVSDITEEEFEYNILEGCKRAGTIGFAGNTSKEFGLPPELCSPILALKRVKGRGVNIFKPQSQEAIKKLIARAGKEKAIAVGIDIDGVGSSNSTLLGKPSYRKTADDIRELKKSTKLPLIIKGVMNAEDAALAVEAGADAIGVSNHGGRVLDSSQGVAEVLPDIAKAVKNAGKKNKKVFITADGGVRTGYDVVKMLALGANFVLIGRPLAREAVLNGAEGVKNFLNYIKQDIRTAMIMTSCNTLSDINERILIKTEY